MLKKKIWQIDPVLDPELLQYFPDHSPLIAQLLFNRGFNNSEAAQSFLASDQAPISHDPFLFADMTAACELIISHIKAHHKIAIAGDYDADGVTSSAVLTETLSAFNAETEVWIPDRTRDGYGLNKRLIDEIKAGGAELIITVDNGIRAIDEVAYARSLGLDIVVTDHHMAGGSPEIYPDCLLINPIIAREHYPFRFLAGVGVAYKLACALISLAKLDDSAKDILRERILDLVAIGTVADCVSLLDENRSLVQAGLKRLIRHPRLGLAELAKLANVKDQITEWSIGWQIAPRLNVAGRLAHASTAYRLLVTKDRAEAISLAEGLNAQNIERQTETARIVDECSALVDSELSSDKILVLLAPELRNSTDAPWFEGVMGLAAGRIAERYGRPTLVVCQSAGHIKGSGRSFGDYSIVGAIEEASDCLARYGGHRAACGFTVKDAASLAEFVVRLRTIGERDLTDELLSPKLKIEAVLEADELNLALAEKLNCFAPFGQGNPLPVFASYNLKIDEVLWMGQTKQHLKLRLGHLSAIAFSALEKWPDLVAGARVNLAYTAEINNFNGRRSLQLKIIDLEIC
jgi:single-stranded-DNA-specific exonuclease